MKRVLVLLILCIFILVGCNQSPDNIPYANPSATNIIATPEVTAEISLPKHSLPQGDPQAFGFSSNALDEIDSFINDEVQNGFPGAVLVVVKDGYIVHQKSYGYAKKYDGKNLLSNPTSMNNDTMFDIASLTKVYGTMFAVMKLIDDDRLALDQNISAYLDGYNEGGREMITVRMLLNHSAGYGSDVRFFDNNTEYTETFYSTDRDKTISLLNDIPLTTIPGETHKYNDIGYMILCQLIEKVTGVSISAYLRDYVYKPLGIENQILYRPLDNSFTADDFVATERMGNTRDGVAYFDGIRKYTLQGEVHDEKTYYSMDSVSGHSGLFADANALAILSQVMLNEGMYQGVQLISSDTVRTFMTIEDQQKYQLTLQNAQSNKYIEKYVSDTALYHYGWTGTAIVIDPTNNMSIILLTNKRHSPCDWDAFEGNDNYETGKYVTIIKMMYQALD
ncbi:MAG: penicillin binding protein PBP4B [Clostridiales bacterium]|nr:penicillin binding protein PBP4B [Clostridiales bacterium]